MFSEIKIGSHTSKNRFVRSATNDRLGHEDGTVSGAQLALYRELAENDIGLIITGHFCVSEAHRASVAQGLVCGERYLPGLRLLSDTVHASGSLLYGQISHGGLKAIENPVDINLLSIAEIETIIEQFITGAQVLAQAGFDGVQLHLAHGYFLSNVLDDTVNHRTDAYGGDDAGRMRMVLQMIAGIRARCPADFGILVKLCVNNSTLAPDYTSHLLRYAALLEQAGVDALELSGTDFASRAGDNAIYYLEQAKLVKAHTRLPVILVGGIHSRAGIQTVLDAGIDMVSMSRPLIAEPDFVSKLRRGETDEAKCVRCNQCYKVYQTQFKRCVQLPPEEQLRKTFG